MMIVLFCGLKPSKSTQQTAFRRFAALRGAALGGAQTKSSPPGTAATLQQHESWEQQDMEFLHGVGVNMGFTIKFNGLTIKQMFDYWYYGLTIKSINFWLVRNSGGPPWHVNHGFPHAAVIFFLAAKVRLFGWFSCECSEPNQVWNWLFHPRNECLLASINFIEFKNC